MVIYFSIYLGMTIPEKKTWMPCFNFIDVDFPLPCDIFWFLGGAGNPEIGEIYEESMNWMNGWMVRNSAKAVTKLCPDVIIIFDLFVCLFVCVHVSTTPNWQVIVRCVSKKLGYPRNAQLFLEVNKNTPICCFFEAEDWCPKGLYI